MKAWDPVAHRWAIAGAVGFGVLGAAFAGSRIWSLALLLWIGGAAWYRLQMDRWFTRGRLLKDPFPEGWRDLLRDRVGYYRGLSPERQAAFEQQVRFFLKEHRFVGLGGEEATDELRLLASASAVMLVFHRPGDEFPRISEVLFYPRSFDEDYRVRGEGRDIIGQNTSYGSVLLSAPDLRRGFRDASSPSHVGLHEFAHALDRQGDRWDGLPTALSGEAADAWGRRLEGERKSILEGRSSLCPYGASNEAEFFAVATETYFKTPDVMRRRNPEIFAILERFYGPLPSLREQPDPAPGKRRPEAAGPPGPREPSPPS